MMVARYDTNYAMHTDGEKRRLSDSESDNDNKLLVCHHLIATSI